MKNRTIIFLVFSMLIGVQLVYSQAKKKKLPRNINMLGYDNFGPAISGDGNSMVYMSNYTNEGNTVLMFTKKVSAASWKDPEELPRTMNIPHLTYQNGYCLNFDGSEFYFTLKKSGGMGGFDIWIIKRQGNSWGAPQNLGSPLNTSLNDGSPSISSDGNALYFMSCETMTTTGASGCKLMVTVRGNSKSKWKKPMALPSQINQGNSLSPKILADGETLMYLSDHEGSMQWYMSRMEGDEWIKPQKMEFIKSNQQRNISVPARGRYVFHDVPSERGSIIEQLLIPTAFKPKDVLRIIGTVKYSEGGMMKVYDVDTRERKVFETLAAGESYDFVLKEGHVYDVSFETGNPKIPTFSEVFDLTEIKFSTRKKWNVNPKVLDTGDSLELKALKFDTVSLRIADQSVYEFRRLTRFLSKNKGGYEVNIFHYPLDTVTIPEIETDSVDNSLDLDIEVDTVAIDSLLLDEVDSSLVSLDAIAVIVEPEIVVPTLAESLAEVLILKLIDKNIPKEQCVVNGITIPLKAPEGNEELADQLFIYLKKTD